MRTIVKKISLDPMKSRRFGIIPGSVPVWNTPIGKFYSYEEAKANIFKANYSLADVKMDFEYVDIDLKKNPMGNYGMIPCDVKINGRFYPYQTVCEWYNFLIKYMEYKGDDGSAENHYLLETVGDAVIEEQIKECREMDRRYTEISLLFNPNEPYQWLSDYCFGGGLTETDNSILTDNDGNKHGFINIPLMITSNIDELGEMSILSEDYQFNIFGEGNAPHELKEGEVYNRPSVFGEDGKIYQMNDVYIIYSGETDSDRILIIDDKVDENGKPMEHSAITYYDYVVEKNAVDYYSSEYGFFTHEGKRAYNAPSVDASMEYPLNKDFENGFVIIDGTVYGVEVNNFVTYSGDKDSCYNGREFPVYSAATNAGTVTLVYCNVGDKEYIARNISGKLKFFFKTPNQCSDDSGCPISDSPYKYIIYQGDYLKLTDNKATLIDSANTQTFVYPIIQASVDIEGTTYYAVNNKLTLQNGFTTPSENTFVADYKESWPSWAISAAINGNTAKVNYNMSVVNNSVITGLTSSKLLSVKDMVSSVDSLGNQMPGNISFEFNIQSESGRTGEKDRVNTKYFEPYNGMLLELPYHVGNASEVQEVDELGLVGTLLTKMKFTTFARGYDEPMSSYTYSIDVTSTANYGDFDNMSDKISKIFDTSANTPYSGAVVDRVECDITYNVGATLEKREYILNVSDVPSTGYSKPYYYVIKGEEDGIKGSSGITYNEHFNVVLKTYPYYVEDGSSISVKYFDLEPTMNRVVINNDDGNKESYEQTAIFSLDVNMYTRSGWTNSNYGYDSKNLSMMAPLTRKEYMLGMTDPQIVEGNIYVDRGINALLEKRMKLCDVNSVEALERYGNNWFKIESYD